VWGQAVQPLCAFGAVIGQQKGLRVFVEFVGAPATETLDRRYFNRAVQALGLPHGPGVGWFGQAVRHAVCPMTAVTTAPTR